MAYLAILYISGVFNHHEGLEELSEGGEDNEVSDEVAEDLV